MDVTVLAWYNGVAGLETLIIFSSGYRLYTFL
nr:hypothetical protein [Tanacetum cinerariifolium]